MKGTRNMNISLNNIMIKILKRYDGSLYNAALAKLVYLVDVEAMKSNGTQISSISWIRDNYGPFVWDIINVAGFCTDVFNVIYEAGNKKLIELKPGCDAEIPEWVERVIDNVVAKTPNPKNNFVAFKDYVYKTAPMLLSTCNGPLNIAEATSALNDVEATLSMMDTHEWRNAIDYLAQN